MECISGSISNWTLLDVKKADIHHVLCGAHSHRNISMQQLAQSRPENGIHMRNQYQSPEFIIPNGNSRPWERRL